MGHGGDAGFGPEQHLGGLLGGVRLPQGVCELAARPRERRQGHALPAVRSVIGSADAHGGVGAAGGGWQCATCVLWWCVCTMAPLGGSRDAIPTLIPSYATQ